MPAVTPPFIPRFGHGAPTGTAAPGTTYYDIDNAYLAYTFNAGQWQPQGGGVIRASGAPTTQLAPPGTLWSRTDAVKLYQSTPTGVAKTIAQFTHNSGHGLPTSATFPGAPTIGNLWIANLGSSNDVHTLIDTTKWTTLLFGGAVKFGVIAYRYVQAGDTATPPNLCTGASNPFWGVEMVEIAGVSGVIANDIAFTTSIFDQPNAFNTPLAVTTQPSQLAILMPSEYNATVANITNPAGWTSQEQWTSGNYGTMLLTAQTPAQGTQLQAAINKATGADPAMYAVTIVFTSTPAGHWDVLV